MLSWDDEDDCYLESLESLKQASASFELHESASCAALLPCGLLPEELEELEELESLKLEADLLKSPASPAAATLKSITIATSGSGDAPAPVAPQGMTPFSGAARLLSDAEDEEVTEEPADDPEEDGGDACADMVPACRQLLRRWLRPWRRRLPAELDSSHQPPQPLRTAGQQHGPLPPRIL